MVAVPQAADDYPAEYRYDGQADELHVGEGVFAPVKPSVWLYEVSGLRVVESWLAYRMKMRAGRTPSPLDSIQPERWTPELTDELLSLLWVVETTVERGSDQEDLLDRILDSSLLLAQDVGEPPEDARRPPTVEPIQPELEGFEPEDAAAG